MNRDQAPTTTRGKVVFFIWKNLPRVVLFLMIVLIVMLTGIIKKEKKLIAAEKAAAISQERPPVNTVLFQLAPTTIRDRINLPGYIEPWTKLELMAKVGGSIAEVLVTEGQDVKKGETLARIEDNDYQIVLKRAKAAYKLAKSEYERDKAVYAKGVIPTAELDLKETTMLTAKADMDNAELMLSRCTIISPMDGIISRLDAKIGLFLSMGDPIAEMLHIERVKAVIGIPESDISAIRKLHEVDLTLKALDDLVVKGKKHFLSSSSDTLARLYRLELELNNESGDILPGMFVRANVIKRTQDNAIAIPFYSVVSRNSQQYVFIEEDGVAKKRPVTLGIMENWMVEVTDGLDSGEKLLIEGHRDVENDQKIKVVRLLTDLREYAL